MSESPLLNWELLAYIDEAVVEVKTKEARGNTRIRS